MSGKSDTVLKRCKVCGNTRYDLPGERSKCPYRTIHERIASPAEARREP